jgi:SAM-dependent methyltransferase
LEVSDQRVPYIFDQARRTLRYRRAHGRQAHDDAARWLDEDMVADALDRLAFMRFEARQVCVLGDASGALGDALGAQGCDVTRLDPETLDEEQPWLQGPFDLVASIRTLATLNDLPGALLHMRKVLAPGGLAMAQILGAGSLATLRRIMLTADGENPAARIHPQIDNRAASALLARSGFTRQVVDSRTLTVRFSSFERLVGDLRDQGLTGILADRPPPLGKAGLARARAAFEDLRDPRGKVSETFEILALTAWR